MRGLEHRVGIGLSIVAALWLAGCTTVPQKELKAYRDAFDQARTAAQEVILDYSSAKEAVEKIKAERAKKKSGPPEPAPLYEFTYRPAVSRAAAKVDDIGERLRALETIARYNQLLVDLAEGKSVEQVSSSAGQLIGTVGNVVKLVPAVGTLLTDFLVALEKARSREEFAKATRAGEKPIVAILDFFIEEVPKYYEVRRDLFLEQETTLWDKIDERVTALEAAAKGLDRSSPVDLRGQEEKINQQLNRIAKTRRAKLVAGGKEGAAPASSSEGALTSSYLSQSVIAVTSDIDQYLATVDKLNTYFKLLQRYEMMLDSAKAAMTTLRLALDAPQDAFAQVEDLLQTALLLRRDFMRLRSHS